MEFVILMCELLFFQPTEQCPHQFGYFKIGDASHCGQFMNCADGRGYTLECPLGLAFNPLTYQVFYLTYWKRLKSYANAKMCRYYIT